MCARLCLVFGTVERALCHLNPFSSDWAFVSPVSKGVLTDHTDAVRSSQWRVQTLLTGMHSKPRAFSTSSWSLLEAERAACML